MDLTKITTLKSNILKQQIITKFQEIIFGYYAFYHLQSDLALQQQIHVSDK